MITESFLVASKYLEGPKIALESSVKPIYEIDLIKVPFTFLT